jgi:hypothetical protein
MPFEIYHIKCNNCDGSGTYSKKIILGHDPNCSFCGGTGEYLYDWYINYCHCELIDYVETKCEFCKGSGLINKINIIE